MDELGEITDYIYEVASDDALIIRGLSKDDNLNEDISVTIIATGLKLIAFSSLMSSPKSLRKWN